MPDNPDQTAALETFFEAVDTVAAASSDNAYEQDLRQANLLAAMSAPYPKGSLR